jgi:hypothetical protein
MRQRSGTGCLRSQKGAILLRSPTVGSRRSRNPLNALKKIAFFHGPADAFDDVAFFADKKFSRRTENVIESGDSSVRIFAGGVDRQTAELD